MWEDNQRYFCTEISRQSVRMSTRNTHVVLVYIDRSIEIVHICHDLSCYFLLFFLFMGFVSYERELIHRSSKRGNEPNLMGCRVLTEKKGDLLGTKLSPQNHMGICKEV